MIAMAEKAQISCVALISGGLDSTLASAIIKAQGIEVLGVFFYTGFCLTEHKRRVARAGEKLPRNEAIRAGADLAIPIEVIDISDEYMNILLHPKHGYGSAANPCLDCRIEMLKRAKSYMQEKGASFIITGEVVGQRPMTQREFQLKLVGRESGCEDILLRPLSAKKLKPTLPEREGWVDRERLYGFTGRGRTPQIALAKEFGIRDYPQPAGGCCFLTDKNFANRLFDLYEHKKKNDIKWEDVTLLKIGRHFRLSDEVKLIVGRHETENLLLEEFEGDKIKMSAMDFKGPIALLEGNPDEELLKIAAGITARYGKGRREKTVRVRCQYENKEEKVIEVAPEFDDLERWRI